MPVQNFLFYRVDRSNPDQDAADFNKEIKSISMILVEDGDMSRHMYTTLEVPRVDHIEVRSFEKEADLLKAFFQVWDEKKVQILQGFNNHGYDNKMLVARRILTGTTEDGLFIRDGKLVGPNGEEHDALLFASKTMRSTDMMDVLRNCYEFQGEELQFSQVCQTLLQESAYGFPEDMEVKPEDYVYANFENTEKIVRMLTKTDEMLQKTGKPFSAAPAKHTVQMVHTLKKY